MYYALRMYKRYNEKKSTLSTTITHCVLKTTLQSIVIIFFKYKIPAFVHVIILTHVVQIVYTFHSKQKILCCQSCHYSA